MEQPSWLYSSYVYPQYSADVVCDNTTSPTFKILNNRDSINLTVLAEGIINNKDLFMGLMEMVLIKAEAIIYPLK